MGETAPETEARRLAEDARDRVRFEEEALELADQERAEISEGGLDADQDGTTTGYLSDRVPGKR